MSRGRSRLRHTFDGIGPAWVRAWARDSATVAGTQFATLAVTTLLAVIVARYLGPSEFGIFAGFLGLSQVVMLVVGVGVPTWLLRELTAGIANDDPAAAASGSHKMSAALALTATLSLTLTVATIVIAAALVSSSDLVIALGALMGYIALLACSTIIEIVFRAHRRLSLVVVATVLEKVSLLGIVVLVIASGAGIAGIAAGYVLAGVLRLSWDLHALRRERVIKFVRPNLTDAKTVVQRSLPVGLSSTIPSAVVRLDVFLIGLASTTVAGLYAVADRFVNVLLIIPVACGWALYAHVAGERDPIRASWRAAGLLAGIGAILALAGALLADVAVPLLFGDQYDAAASAVRIMMLGVPLMFAAYVVLPGLLTGGHERPVLVVMMSCTLAGTVLVVAGRVAFGLDGAAAGYVGRYVLQIVGLAALSVMLSLSGNAQSQSAAATKGRPPAALEPGGPAND